MSDTTRPKGGTGFEPSSPSAVDAEAAGLGRDMAGGVGNTSTLGTDADGAGVDAGTPGSMGTGGKTATSTTGATTSGANAPRK